MFNYSPTFLPNPPTGYAGRVGKVLWKCWCSRPAQLSSTSCKQMTWQRQHRNGVQPVWIYGDRQPTPDLTPRTPIRNKALFGGGYGYVKGGYSLRVRGPGGDRFTSHNFYRDETGRVKTQLDGRLGGGSINKFPTKVVQLRFFFGGVGRLWCGGLLFSVVKLQVSPGNQALMANQFGWIFLVGPKKQ